MAETLQVLLCWRRCPSICVWITAGLRIRDVLGFKKQPSFSCNDRVGCKSYDCQLGFVTSIREADIRTALSRFEDHSVLSCFIWWKVQETKAKIGGTMALACGERKCSAILLAIITAFKSPVHFAAGSPWKAVLPPSQTIRKEVGALDTEVPEAYVELIANWEHKDFNFHPFWFNEAVFCVYDTDPRQITKRHKMKTINNLLETIHFTFTGLHYNVQRKCRLWKWCMYRDNIRDLVKLCSEVTGPCAHWYMFPVWIQLGRWYQTLQSQEEEVSREQAVEGEEVVLQNLFFEVHTKPCRYTRASDN